MGILVFLWILFYPFEALSGYQLLPGAVNHHDNLKIDRGTDFNKDNVKDVLQCRYNEIVIRDGKNHNRLLLRWSLPHQETRHGSYQGVTKLFISGCQVARIHGNHPSVMISSSYANPNVGARLPAVQYLLFNRGEGSSGGLARMVPQGLVIEKPSGQRYFYRSAARGLACEKFPERLVRAGFNPGALCFYAGYDSPLSGGRYGTTTALLKLEEGVDGKAIAVDLTPGSGLPWSGGALGTPMQNFPTIRIGHGSRRYDGLHMMDGAFLDYNSDGLPDLITVGQHASIRLATMVFDPHTEEGVTFQNSKIHQAGPGRMTEFLRVTSFSELNSQVPEKCVYISGEEPNVIDHIRCYQGSRWVTHSLPERISSREGRPGINQIPGTLGTYIRTYDHLSRQLKYIRLIPEVGPIIGYFDRVTPTPQGLRIQGWVCQQRVNESVHFHVYVGHSAFEGGQIVAGGRAQNRNAQGVNNRCQSPGHFRFNIVIPKHKLTGHAGKKIYIHGIKRYSHGPGRNNTIQRSGVFAVPRF